MRIAVIGTGSVGRALAGALAGAGHQVVVGTRNPDETLARSEPDRMGRAPYAEWAAAHPDVPLTSFAEAGGHGQVVVNATSGDGSLSALAAAGDLDGRVVLDVANPLDHSVGFPPILSVANDDSLAERIQRAHPGARVVKTLNTVTANVMVEPGLVPGEHNLFMAGDDAGAKEVVVGLLGDLGWPASRVLDLGGIRAARSLEMYLPLWLSLMSAGGSAVFNIAVVRPTGQ